MNKVLFSYEQEVEEGSEFYGVFCITKNQDSGEVFILCASACTCCGHHGCQAISCKSASDFDVTQYEDWASDEEKVLFAEQISLAFNG